VRVTSAAPALVRRVATLAVVLLLAAGCAGEPSFETVDELFEAVGGATWCDDELRVTLEPFVGSCGDPATDSRVVLGVGGGGEELRASIENARDNLAEDGQLLLVPSDPDRPAAWQLRSRDRALLEAARDQIGGVLLDEPAAVDEWLER
jgi:hypothetical protein